MPLPDDWTLPRRSFFRRATAAGAALALAGTGTDESAIASGEGASAPLRIGSRRELFLDDLLIDRITGQADRRIHHPQPRAIVMEHDQPWEGTGSGYHSIFQDGGLYRMYYKAWHIAVSPGKADTETHPLYCCYAESDDGIRLEFMHQASEAGSAAR